MFSSMSNWLFHEDQEDFEKFKRNRNRPQIKLPQNFAQDIFDLELQCEDEDVKIDIVNQLLNLYKIGTEYYESQNSKKYKVFMQKQQSLLIRHNIQQAIYTPTQDPKQMVSAFQQEASIINTIHFKDLDNQSQEIQRRLLNRQLKTQFIFQY